jgi:2-dehydro-3-deoxy-D-gluconate 5-dehydrogenase
MNAFDLSGKNALVTGSARGLGAAIALGLAEAGANVVCHGTKGDSAPACDAIRKLGRKSGYVAANVATREACTRLFDQALAQLGSIDILINNAGTIRRAAAAEHSEDFWNEVIAVNLNSVFWLSQLAGRHMLPRGSGKIVNIASLLSFQGGVTVPSYAAAKGGVAQLTKALANEWSSKGVNVNAIAPGYMETDNTAALRADAVRNRQIMERIPAGRWGKPADLAGAAIFLSSAASDYVHGHVLVVDGGWLAR